MQCIRGNPKLSTASSTSLSAKSINIYFERHSSRKSFLRRSFDVVRKSVARQSLNLSRRSLKTGKSIRDVFGDHNNNRNSQDTVFVYSKSGEGSVNTYDGDILTFSSDWDIIDSRKKQLNNQDPRKR